MGFLQVIIDWFKHLFGRGDFGINTQRVKELAKSGTYSGLNKLHDAATALHRLWRSEKRLKFNVSGATGWVKNLLNSLREGKELHEALDHYTKNQVEEEELILGIGADIQNLVDTQGKLDQGELDAEVQMWNLAKQILSETEEYVRILNVREEKTIPDETSTQWEVHIKELGMRISQHIGLIVEQEQFAEKKLDTSKLNIRHNLHHLRREVKSLKNIEADSGREIKLLQKFAKKSTSAFEKAFKRKLAGVKGTTDRSVQSKIDELQHMYDRVKHQLDQWANYVNSEVTSLKSDHGKLQGRVKRIRRSLRFSTLKFRLAKNSIVKFPWLVHKLRGLSKDISSKSIQVRNGQMNVIAYGARTSPQIESFFDTVVSLLKTQTGFCDRLLESFLKMIDLIRDCAWVIRMQKDASVHRRKLNAYASQFEQKQREFIKGLQSGINESDISKLEKTVDEIIADTRKEAEAVSFADSYLKQEFGMLHSVANHINNSVKHITNHKHKLEIEINVHKMLKIRLHKTLAHTTINHITAQIKTQQKLLESTQQAGRNAA